VQSSVWAISIALGASAQPVILTLDTGSSDTWINSASSDLCKSETGCGRVGGSFNAQASTSVGQAFAYTYYDGAQASGDYFRDTLSFAGQSLPNFQFAVGTSTKPAIGRFGLGYPTSQVVASNGGSPYATIYDILISKGLIGTKSFSLWLDSATSGRILFGGVNKARYSGTLGSVAIQQVGGAYKEFAISLTGMSISLQGQTVDLPSSATNLPVNVVLNSASLFTYLPPQIADNIFRGLQVAGTASRDGAVTAFVDCTIAQSGITIDFSFGSVKISVPITGFLFAFDVYKQSSNSGAQLCALKIRPREDSKHVLGLSFFETAYVVFDLTSNQISLAPAVKGATTDDIVEIGTAQNASTGGEETSNEGTPVPDGLVLVDPADYPTLSSGDFVSLDEYEAEKKGGEDQSSSQNNEAGGNPNDLVEVNPADFGSINPADLITYDEFIASANGNAANNDSNPETAAATTEETTTNPNDATVVTDPGAPVTTDNSTPATAGTGSQSIDPVTGLPIVSTEIIGGTNSDPQDDPYTDPVYGDPYVGGEVFKRVPAPAALRKRRVT
jgi:hypothetical protein